MLQNGLSGRISLRYDSTPSLAIQADLIFDRNVTLAFTALIGPTVHRYVSRLTVSLLSYYKATSDQRPV